MILDKIVERKRIQIEEEKKLKPLSQVIKSIEKTEIHNRDFKGELSKEGISIIAEIKKASPSKGIILEDFNPSNIARIYEEINIDLISVLTEKHFFKGDDEYLKNAKKITNKPVLRKDFIIDPYQIYTSKLIGADGILLIAAILGDELREFHTIASELGLKCLVEVHSKEELLRVLDIDADIIGINNRNLNDFTVSLSNTEELIEYIPKDKIVISESGITTPLEIKSLRQMGVDGVLIGESFMRKINDISEMKKFVTQSKGGN